MRHNDRDTRDLWTSDFGYVNPVLRNMSLTLGGCVMRDLQKAPSAAKALLADRHAGPSTQDDFNRTRYYLRGLQRSLERPAAADAVGLLPLEGSMPMHC